METKISLRRAAPFLLVGLAIAAPAIAWLFDWRMGNAFQHVQIGDTQKTVFEFLGPPARVEPCGPELWWGTRDLGKNDGRCASTARYTSVWNAWTVGYSADGRVVAKHQVGSSP